MTERRSVAFLRGINVGGHRVGPEDLVAVFEAVGHDRVSTFLASGNVLFSHRDEVDVARIEVALSAALGYEVPTTIRSADQLRKIADHEPFPPDAIAASEGKPQVLLLFVPASQRAERETLALAGSDDRLAFDGDELHWLPSGGILDSELDLNRLSDVLGTYTMRTANTIRRLTATL